jgi:3-phenylpropionate/trans-cinnamate dioxygenase ferredoxin reductase component
MAAPSRVVIVGAGQAGGWAAKTLRKRDASASIVLIGDEPHPPHERPPLSKDVLLGLKPPSSTYIFTRESLSVSEIALRHARAVAIDRAAKQVLLSDGDQVPYDRLLLTVGSRVKPLDVPGIALGGIHSLRTIEDSLAIERHLRAGAHIMIVGGGWIGLEVASAARKRGARVTVIEFCDRLCARVLPQGELERYLLDLQNRNGVDVRLNTTVVAFGGASKVEYAALSSGEEMPVSAVVVGIGVVPTVDTARDAGLETENGIVVDQYCRTSDPNIFAAGDCTSQPCEFLGRRVRLESWYNAQNQAIAAANVMAGDETSYQEIPWFWSDQHEVNLQLLGTPSNFDEVVTRGDVGRDRFVQFYLAKGQIMAAAGVNCAREIRSVRQLMKGKKLATPERLAFFAL